MKIYYQLEEEKNNEDKIIQDILKGKLSLIDIFDKAYFIEKIYLQMKEGGRISIKIDEEKKDYPNFLKTDIPRMIIQNDEKMIPFSEYIKNFNDLKLEKKGNDYILTIIKKDSSIDLNLKVDKDKTIDLSWISADKSKKDNTFFGIKSYFYIKRNET